MAWVTVLICDGCDEFIPFDRHTTLPETEAWAECRKWIKHHSRWYCATCWRAMRLREDGRPGYEELSQALMATKGESG